MCPHIFKDRKLFSPCPLELFHAAEFLILTGWGGEDVLERVVREMFQVDRALDM
jgi:hypothetical protein